MGLMIINSGHERIFASGVTVINTVLLMSVATLMSK